MDNVNGPSRIRQGAIVRQTRRIRPPGKELKLVLVFTLRETGRNVGRAVAMVGVELELELELAISISLSVSVRGSTYASLLD